MKKSILILAAAFTFSAFFTSCRETAETERTETEVNEDLNEVGNDVERAAEDVGNTIEEGANEVEQEIEGTDDL